MTAPRGGTAVMAHRGEPAGSADDFPTPPWATRALLEWLRAEGVLIHPRTRCREPASGRGHMARALGEVFGSVERIDRHDYGAPLDHLADFLDGRTWPWVEWTITNPPFRLAEAFIRTALGSSLDGVAMLVRTQFLEGAGRHERLYAVRPPTAVLQFVERVPMLRGRLDPAGSTATAYCWLVWNLTAPGPGTRLVWLPPCRRRLEREGDYA